MYIYIYIYIDIYRYNRHDRGLVFFWTVCGFFFLPSLTDWGSRSLWAPAPPPAHSRSKKPTWPHTHAQTRSMQPTWPPTQNRNGQYDLLWAITSRATVCTRSPKSWARALSSPTRPFWPPSNGQMRTRTRSKRNPRQTRSSRSPTRPKKQPDERFYLTAHGLLCARVVGGEGFSRCRCFGAQGTCPRQTGGSRSVWVLPSQS